MLVIDDEASVQSAMRLLLEEMGCTCLVAADLAEALRLSEAQAPDFVISDFRLKSSGNGIDAIAQLRQRFPGLPAVLVSGDTAPARLTLAHQARLRVCHKPLSMQTLRELLSQVSHRQA